MARTSRALIALFAALVAASCNGAETTAHTRADAQSVVLDEHAACAQHFGMVSAAESTKVKAVRQLGPQVKSPPSGPFDRYEDDVAVSLCLVPGDHGNFEVYGLVASDQSRPIHLWTQNGGGGFAWPI